MTSIFIFYILFLFLSSLYPTPSPLHVMGERTCKQEAKSVISEEDGWTVVRGEEVSGTAMMWLQGIGLVARGWDGDVGEGLQRC